MNTERSDRKVREFLRRPAKRERKTVTVERILPAPPETVFPQLCPSRELDWIDGWDCELVHTSTGYVEKDCVFTTDESNVLGSGLWIVAGYEPNEKLDVVIVGDSVIEHFTIHLTDNRDGTSTGRWDMTFTALNEAGDKAVTAISEDDPALERAIDGLAHFLQTGEMLEG